MSDFGDDEPKVVIDYNALDEVTGFKKADITIWEAYSKSVLEVPEDDRPDAESWADEWAEEKGYDKRRVKAVTTLGIYAGPRDEFNQRTRSGKAIYANGDVYEGEFLEGKKHGQGHYTFTKQGKSEVDKLIEKMVQAKPADEPQEAFTARCAKALQIGTAIVEAALEYGFLACYHGDYIRGMRTGQGLMKNSDGTLYKGDFSGNARHGQGMFYFLNGDVYSGEWSEGKKHGFGTYRFATGGEYRGEWSKGVFTDGQWIMQDGIYFEGKFDKRNRPCDANGTMHFPHLAMSIDGDFRMGRWAPLSTLQTNGEVPVDESAWAE